MRDTIRDELEMKILWALVESASHDTLIETLNEALSYVQNNPSIVDIKMAALELEVKMVKEASDSLFEGGADYDEHRDELDKYHAAIRIMENHA